MTLQEFYDLRVSDDCDIEDVTVWMDDGIACPVERFIPVGIKSTRGVDFRFFAGLAVFVYAEQYTDELVAFVEKLKKTAAFILVGVIEFGADVGWTWTKQTGEQPV